MFASRICLKIHFVLTSVPFIIVIGWLKWTKIEFTTQIRTVSYIMRIKWIARWSTTKAVTCIWCFSLSLSLFLSLLLSRSFRMIFDQTFSLSDWPNFRLLNTFVKKVGYPSKYGYSAFFVSDIRDFCENYTCDQYDCSNVN